MLAIANLCSYMASTEIRLCQYAVQNNFFFDTDTPSGRLCETTSFGVNSFRATHPLRRRQSVCSFFVNYPEHTRALQPFVFQRTYCTRDRERESMCNVRRRRSECVFVMLSYRSLAGVGWLYGSLALYRSRSSSLNNIQPHPRSANIIPQRPNPDPYDGKLLAGIMVLFSTLLVIISIFTVSAHILPCRPLRTQAKRNNVIAYSRHVSRIAFKSSSLSSTAYSSTWYGCQNISVQLSENKTKKQYNIHAFDETAVAASLLLSPFV